MFSQLSLQTSHRPASVRLSSIVNEVHVVHMSGPWDADIAGITTDSRQVRDRWCFVAVEGEHVDGHRFVQRAIEQGASCVVVQETQYRDGLHELLTAAYIQHNATTIIVTPDSRRAVAVLARAFHGTPDSRMTLIGVTGTNGKTTTSMLIHSALRAAGLTAGLLGTIEYRIGTRVESAPFTTPPAEELYRVLADMERAGCTHVVMEVSSHALALQRVHGLSFAATVFTNLTQDHLDFHGNMEAYADAKVLLFGSPTRGTGVINLDDPYASRMLAPLGRRRLTYGMHPRAALRITSVKSTSTGLRVELLRAGRSIELRSRLSGDFNAWNIAAAYGVCTGIGLPDDAIARGIRSLARVPGRFERVRSVDGVTAVVDYAHTPDALQHALRSARTLAGRGRVLVVFGCGGDRDHGKRPQMGRAATTLADAVYVTSDNPRSEDPQRILDDILAGAIPGSSPHRIVSRRAAIRRAIRDARPGDVVLVAGKGHETVQITGTRRTRFDDLQVVTGLLAQLHGGVR